MSFRNIVSKQFTWVFCALQYHEHKKPRSKVLDKWTSLVCIIRFVKTSINRIIVVKSP